MARKLFSGDDEDPFQRDRGEPLGELDMTPMIDVTFQLLIFFMVASNMQSTPALDLPVAEHSKGVTVSSSAVITVKAPTGSESSAKILLETEKGEQYEVVMGDLSAYLQDQQRQGISKIVINAEGDVTHGIVDEISRAIKSVEGMDLYLGVGDAPAH